MAKKKKENIKESVKNDDVIKTAIINFNTKVFEVTYNVTKDSVEVKEV